MTLSGVQGVFVVVNLLSDFVFQNNCAVEGVPSNPE